MSRICDCGEIRGCNLGGALGATKLGEGEHLLDSGGAASDSFVCFNRIFDGAEERALHHDSSKKVTGLVEVNPLGWNVAYYSGIALLRNCCWTRHRATTASATRIPIETSAQRCAAAIHGASERGISTTIASVMPA